MESAKWLTNSLHPSLILSLHSELKKNPTGPVLWMAIIFEVRSNSVCIVRETTDKFYALQVSDSPGENMDKFAAEAANLLELLELEGEYKILICKAPYGRYRHGYHFLHVWRK